MKTFFDKCLNAGNPYMLLMYGMRELRANGQNRSSLGALSQASDLGHMVAKYAYGIILLCNLSRRVRSKGFDLMDTLFVVDIRDAKLKVRSVLWDS